MCDASMLNKRVIFAMRFFIMRSRIDTKKCSLLSHLRSIYLLTYSLKLKSPLVASVLLKYYALLLKIYEYW